LTLTTITVAIAACGRPAELQRAVRAIACGVRQPDEVIVVDQAPSAAARAALDVLGPVPHRYVEQERLGLSALRNLALQLASGAVVAMTDDDCVADESWVDVVHASFSDPESADTLTGSVLPLGDAAPGAYMVSARSHPAPYVHTRRVPPWHIGSGGNFAGRRRVLEAVGGWDVRLGAGSPGRSAEVIELLDRILRYGYAIRYEPAAIVRHQLQDRQRRLSTRWTYGFGIGAFLALRAKRADRLAVAALTIYVECTRPRCSAPCVGAAGSTPTSTCARSRRWFPAPGTACASAGTDRLRRSDRSAARGDRDVRPAWCGYSRQPERARRRTASTKRWGAPGRATSSWACATQHWRNTSSRISGDQPTARPARSS